MERLWRGWAETTSGKRRGSLSERCPLCFPEDRVVLGVFQRCLCRTEGGGAGLRVRDRVGVHAGGAEPDALAKECIIIIIIRRRRRTIILIIIIIIITITLTITTITIMVIINKDNNKKNNIMIII